MGQPLTVLQSTLPLPFGSHAAATGMETVWAIDLGAVRPRLVGATCTKIQAEQSFRAIFVTAPSSPSQSRRSYPRSIHHIRSGLLPTRHSR
jgi:hypothetical protein